MMKEEKDPREREKLEGERERKKLERKRETYGKHASRALSIHESLAIDSSDLHFIG